MTTQQFLEIKAKMPQTVSIDEPHFYGGNFKYAFGHTADTLIYWTADGKGMTSRRDTSRTYHDLHDEFYQGNYEDNPEYNFETLMR